MSIHKTKFNTRTRAIVANNLERRLFYVLITLLLLSAISYMYFVAQTTFNIIERKNAQHEISILGSHIGELELEYLSLNNQIDLDFAYKLGFQEPRKIHFASREALVKR